MVRLSHGMKPSFIPVDTIVDWHLTDVKRCTRNAGMHTRHPAAAHSHLFRTKSHLRSIARPVLR